MHKKLYTGFSAGGSRVGILDLVLVHQGMKIGPLHTHSGCRPADIAPGFAKRLDDKGLLHLAEVLAEDLLFDRF